MIPSIWTLLIALGVGGLIGGWFLRRRRSGRGGSIESIITPEMMERRKKIAEEKKKTEKAKGGFVDEAKKYEKTYGSPIVKRALRLLERTGRSRKDS